MQNLLGLFRGSASSSRSSRTRLKVHRNYLKDAEAKFQERYKNASLCPAVDIEYFQTLRLISDSQTAYVYEVNLRQAVTRVYAAKSRNQAMCYNEDLIPRAIEEKKILFGAQSDFVIKLFYTARDRIDIFLILEYAPEGDLSNITDRSEKAVRPIAAQVVLGLEYLQTCKVLHRDLQPCHILRFPGGRVKIGGFGWACLVDKYPAAGQPGGQEYLAPECFFGGYGLPSDWWSFGVLIYGLLTTCLPYHGYRKEFSDRKPLAFPEEAQLSNKVRDLLERLMEYDTNTRLGLVKNGESNIRSHPWFKKTDFADFLDNKPETAEDVEDPALLRGPIAGPSRPMPIALDQDVDRLFKDFGLNQSMKGD